MPWAVVKLYVAGLLLGLVGFFIYRAGEHHVQNKFDAHLLADAQAAQKATEAARAQEHALADANTKAAQAYEQGKQDAEAAGKSVADGLRAGSLQLRKRWQGCEAERVSGAAPGAAGADDSSEGRADSAGRIIAATHDDAEKIKALQDLLRSERK